MTMWHPVARLNAQQDACAGLHGRTGEICSKRQHSGSCIHRSGKDRRPANGEVAEWSKAHAWKVCRRETVSRVRIPVSPPEFLLIALCGCSLAGLPWCRRAGARPAAPLGFCNGVCSFDKERCQHELKPSGTVAPDTVTANRNPCLCLFGIASSGCQAVFPASQRHRLRRALL